jgi:hypothetical protein
LKNYSTGNDAKHRCLAFIHILSCIKLDYLKEESIMSKMKFGILLVFAVLALVGTVSAFGPISFPYDGKLVVTYVKSDAGYDNVFGIYLPVDQELGAIHEPDAAAPGTEYPIENYLKDAPVVLYIATPHENIFRSDVVGEDGENHANVIAEADGSYTVAFEDKTAAEESDWDYNDVVLNVRCIPDPINAPEFPTLALPVGLIIGMLGVVLFIQKTKEE